ncbi:unnamed protein product [Lactuca saligna]|uniref:Uncharacterized protein n=1 Tax=Lactuca saligna TaxID=75948 RepID=A0AA35VKA3_LACSI|nr:unnamed protein product [Lactuca saligna]
MTCGKMNESVTSGKKNLHLLEEKSFMLVIEDKEDEGLRLVSLEVGKHADPTRVEPHRVLTVLEPLHDPEFKYRDIQRIRHLFILSTHTFLRRHILLFMLGDISKHTQIHIEDSHSANIICWPSILV